MSSLVNFNESKRISEEEESEEKLGVESEEEEEGSFEGDNFDDYFEDQNEVAVPEQVLLWTTIEGKDYVKCEETGTIYDFETFRNSFELVVVGKLSEDGKRVVLKSESVFTGIGEGEGAYVPGLYVPGFNPHTDTKNYRIS
jgi:hypothetical protein